MGKLPAFLFYPGDWIQDTRPLSLAAKGAWIDLLCALWRAPQRGVLELPPTGFARIIAASVEETSTMIDELLSLGICDSDSENSDIVTEAQGCVTPRHAKITLINRRMLREDRAKKSSRYRSDAYRKRKNHAEITPSSSVTVSDSPSVAVAS